MKAEDQSKQIYLVTFTKFDIYFNAENEHLSRKYGLQEIITKTGDLLIQDSDGRRGRDEKKNASFVKSLVFAYFCVYRSEYFTNVKTPQKGPPGVGVLDFENPL